jgi:hypothetical protein
VASLHLVPVATRLSWAAHRETSRHEDSAYCLLGLFGVHMPLIYGETENAFLRLQEEIVKTTNDLSIFAWKALPEDTQENRGIFARSAAEFKHCTNLKRVTTTHQSDREFRVTNKGVRFEQRLTPSFLPAFMYEMDLECQLNGSLFVGIFLAKVEERYIRVRPHELVKKDRRAARQGSGTPFYVTKTINKDDDAMVGFLISQITELLLVFDPNSVTILGVEPYEDWHPVQRTFCKTLSGRYNYTCYWHLQVKQQDVEPGKGETQRGNCSFQCLVACRLQDWRPASYYVWSQQDPEWNDLLSRGPADDGWRDYRFSPSLINSPQSTSPMSVSIEEVAQCILHDSRHKDEREIAAHQDLDSRVEVRLLVMEPETWYQDLPRRCTLTLSMKETHGEYPLLSRENTRHGLKDVDTHEGGNDTSAEKTEDLDDEQTKDVIDENDGGTGHADVTLAGGLRHTEPSQMLLPAR